MFWVVTMCSSHFICYNGCPFADCRSWTMWREKITPPSSPSRVPRHLRMDPRFTFCRLPRSLYRCPSSPGDQVGSLPPAPPGNTGTLEQMGQPTHQITLDCLLSRHHYWGGFVEQNRTDLELISKGFPGGTWLSHRLSRSVQPLVLQHLMIPRL